MPRLFFGLLRKNPHFYEGRIMENAPFYLFPRTGTHEQNIYDAIVCRRVYFPILNYVYLYIQTCTVNIVCVYTYRLTHA